MQFGFHTQNGASLYLPPAPSNHQSQWSLNYRILLLQKLFLSRRHLSAQLHGGLKQLIKLAEQKVQKRKRGWACQNPNKLHRISYKGFLVPLEGKKESGVFQLFRFITNYFLGTLSGLCVSGCQFLTNFTIRSRISPSIKGNKEVGRRGIERIYAEMNSPEEWNLSPLLSKITKDGGNNCFPLLPSHTTAWCSHQLNILCLLEWGNDILNSFCCYVYVIFWSIWGKYF